MVDDKSNLRKMLENLKYGDTIVYQVKGEVYATYLIVEEVKNGKISGQMSCPIGVNSISLERLLEHDEISIAEFKKLITDSEHQSL